MSSASTPQAKGHRYKRRTWDEAFEIARTRFQAEVATHFSPHDLEQLRASAAADTSLVLGGGPVCHPESWLHLTTAVPDRDSFYEVRIYEAARYEGGPSPKIWVRILASRDRESDLCIVDWHPIQDHQDNEPRA